MIEAERKVLIFEDHEIVASGVARLITHEFDGLQPTIAITFPDGLELLQASGNVELIILDVQLPGGEGVKMISRIRKIQPGVRILIFSVLEDLHHILTFMNAGANGFASKTLKLHDLKEAIAAVLSEMKYISEEVLQTVADSFFQNLSPAAVCEEIRLSAREREVMDLLLMGKRIKEISYLLNLGITTVSTHKTNIFKKMGVDNIVDLVNKFNKRNMTDGPAIGER